MQLHEGCHQWTRKIDHKANDSCLGVYACVVSEGTIRVGDDVVLGLTAGHHGEDGRMWTQLGGDQGPSRGQGTGRVVTQRLPAWYLQITECYQSVYLTSLELWT